VLPSERPEHVIYESASGTIRTLLPLSLNSSESFGCCGDLVGFQFPGDCLRTGLEGELIVD